MKLHKTRDGETKTRGLDGWAHFRRELPSGPFRLYMLDERGSHWTLEASDDEAAELLRQLLVLHPRSSEVQRAAASQGERARDSHRTAEGVKPPASQER